MNTSKQNFRKVRSFDDIHTHLSSAICIIWYPHILITCGLYKQETCKEHEHRLERERDRDRDETCGGMPWDEIWWNLPCVFFRIQHLVQLAEIFSDSGSPSPHLHRAFEALDFGALEGIPKFWAPSSSWDFSLLLFARWSFWATWTPCCLLDITKNTK